jgi:hypothetical protein
VASSISITPDEAVIQSVGLFRLRTKTVVVIGKDGCRWKASLRQQLPYPFETALSFLSSRAKRADLQCAIRVPQIYRSTIPSSPDKAVILSEALRRSFSNRELYSAESKDLGDACRQLHQRAFRPQTTTEDKKPTNYSTKSGKTRLKFGARKDSS